MRPADAIWSAAGSAGSLTFAVSGEGGLPSAFAVTSLAVEVIGAAGAAMAEYITTMTGQRPAISVDRRLASFWLQTTIRPIGWALPPSWDDLAGDYQARDGWIRLHTNAPHHRAAALSVLGGATERGAVAAAVAAWEKDALEGAIVAAGGAAAALRSQSDWAAHPQGRAVASEPLIHLQEFPPVQPFNCQSRPSYDPDRPLAGLRVLDLTRVLAGPTATRFLAGFGAIVLRLDPPFWHEPSLEPEMTLGKYCAALDLRDPAGRDRFRALLANADILVHGYRPGALAGLGLDDAERRALNPALIDVSLDAYGWTGPWAGRRGFDSLIQMSAGIADTGRRAAGVERPVPLPAQAIDHVTGYVLATAALRALSRRIKTGAGTTARASLARTSLLLEPATMKEAELEPPTAADVDPAIELTAWGPAHRLLPPLTLASVPIWWRRPAGHLHTASPDWPN